MANVECGVWTPKDGDVDPTTLTTVISRYAKADGASFRFNAEVEAVRRGGEWPPPSDAAPWLHRRWSTLDKKTGRMVNDQRVRIEATPGKRRRSS